MTERLHFHFSLSCIGEGNGNPLQFSCLENPRDRGAWWAAIYGITHSQTRLKLLSSSSRSSISPFNICCKAGLVGLNSLNFCLSEKLFISPSILNEIHAMYSNLGCRFSLFSTLHISYHSLLPCQLSAERSAVRHMGFPLCVTCCLSLAAFNILSLSLVFVSLVSIHPGVFLLGFILYGTLHFLDLNDYFLPDVGVIFNYNLFKKFFFHTLSFSLLLLLLLLLLSHFRRV